MGKKTIAISLGDINGVGVQIALENHKKIQKYCKPIYCINYKLLKQAAKLLKLKIPKDFIVVNTYKNFKIKPGVVDKESGKFSYLSFLKAINLARDKYVDGICTLPINKEAWNRAGLDYVGHTDLLRKIFKKDAIMMLGCKKFYVALFTEHIPLKNVFLKINEKELYRFFKDFYKSEKPKKVAVLGLNPHAGDNGVLGNEEEEIKKAIKKINKELNSNIFEGVMVPDIAFTKKVRKNYKYFIAMYHDQGLAPLKALYFDEAINVSLNLPIKRTSVDHGSAFDIAYKKDNRLSAKSYINAIKKLVS